MSDNWDDVDDTVYMDYLDDLIDQLQTRHIKLGFNEVTESLFIAAANELVRLRADNARLREALEKIAKHPTGGVGCNPVVFVKEARAALAEQEEK